MDRSPSQEHFSENGKLINFIYVDHGNNGKLIFKCSAPGILEADRLFEDALGKNPKSNPNVGCVVESEINKDWIEKNNK